MSTSQHRASSPKFSLIRVAAASLYAAVAMSGPMLACTPKAAPEAAAPPAETEAAAGPAAIPTAALLKTSLKEVEAIVDDTCRCPDDACVKMVRPRLTAFMLKTRGWARPDMDAPSTKEFMAKMADAGRRMQACIDTREKADAASKAPETPEVVLTPPTPAQLQVALTDFKAIVADFCKCSGPTCVKANQAALTNFMARTRSWGRPDLNDPVTKDFLGKMQIAGKKLQACLAKAEPRPAPDGK